MVLPDVNVFVNAHREDAQGHDVAHRWLVDALESDRAFAYSELVLSGFIRVITHPRIFQTPTELEQALSFAAVVRERPNAVPVSPGRRHWDVFTGLCTEAGARGNLVPDAYLAALAIESGCELVSTDRDFSRFPGLRWAVPGDER